MGKNDHSRFSNDVEIGNPSPLDMSDSKNRSFPKMEDEKYDHQFTLQDLWTDIAQEEPPTYHRTRESSEIRPNESNFQSTQSGCKADVHISYCHYAALVFTIICLGVIIIFYTATALHRADPLIVISELHMTSSEQSCVDAKPSAGISIDIEPHFVILNQSANLTTITNYKTLTETSTTLSTLLSTITVNTCANLSPATRNRTTVRIATTTFISPILQVSTVILTPSSQAPSTLTVTRTRSGCAALTTSERTTTMVATENSSPPIIKPSTRYFTGPNLVGSILNGS